MSISRLMQMGAAGAGEAVEYSAYTFGATAGIEVLSVSGSDFATGDFTYEAWIFASDNRPNYAAIVGHTWGSGGGLFYLRSNGSLTFYDGGDILTTTDGDVSAGVWTHVAAVRSSGTLTIYVDGTSVGTTSYTNSITDTNLYVGQNQANNEEFPGYIWRPHVLDVAKYTSSFTPDTDYLPEANTLMLIEANASTFTDTEGNTVTNNDATPAPHSPNYKLDVSSYSTVGTSSSSTLPSGISAGDLIVIGFSGTSASGFTAPAGYSVIYNDATFITTGEPMAMVAKIADGTESSTVVANPFTSVVDPDQRTTVFSSSLGTPVTFLPIDVEIDSSTTSAVVDVVCTSSQGPSFLVTYGYQKGSTNESNSTVGSWDDSLGQSGGGSGDLFSFMIRRGFYSDTSGGNAETTFGGTGANFKLIGALLFLA